MNKTGRSELNVKVAAKMYKCRDTARSLYKERFPEKMTEYQGYIKGYMSAHGGDEINAVIKLAAKVKGDSCEGAVIMLLTAAVTEILEPSI